MKYLRHINEVKKYLPLYKEEEMALLKESINKDFIADLKELSLEELDYGLTLYITIFEKDEKQPVGSIDITHDRENYNAYSNSYEDWEKFMKKYKCRYEMAITKPFHTSKLEDAAEILSRIKVMYPDEDIEYKAVFNC